MAFETPIPRDLAVFVGQRCSASFCRRRTMLPGEVACVGEAAHIEGGAPRSARYNELHSDIYRHSDTNGIWLCRDCHKLVDRCPVAFPVYLLHQWKADARALYLYEATTGTYEVQGDSQPYITRERAERFCANHWPLANAYVNLNRRFYGQRNILVTEELRLGVWHAEMRSWPTWGLGRADYVVEPTINARQNLMLHMVDHLQTRPQFGATTFNATLDFTANIDDKGDVVYTDRVVQMLYAHYSLLSDLLPTLDHVLAVRGPRTAAHHAESIYRSSI